MTVYSVTAKILKKNAGLILLYIGIFIGISVMLAQYSDNSEAGVYKNEKISVAVIDYDHSALSEAITNEIDKNADICEIKDSKEGCADALFHRIVEYIVIIPAGYESAFLNGKEITLEKMEVADSYSGIYVDNMINSYLDSVESLIENMPDKSIGEIIDMADKNAENGVNVEFVQENMQQDNFMSRYFNYSCYGIMASVILGVGIVINSFTEKNIRERNAVAPIGTVKLYRQICLCTIGFVVVIWAICEVAGIILIGKDLFTAKGLVMSLNMFVMTLVAMSIGFVVSLVVKNKNARGAATNTISLFLSFISGIMVPMELLGKEVKLVASFTPTFWNVKLNDMMGGTVRVCREELIEAAKYIGIQFLFVFALIGIGMVVAKKSIIAENKS